MLLTLLSPCALPRLCLRCRSHGQHPAARCRRFPYICSLRSQSGRRHVCGATLLAPSLAITAAFCVSPPAGVPDPLLWCGLLDLSSPPPPAQFDELQAVQTIK